MLLLIAQKLALEEQTADYLNKSVERRLHRREKALKKQTPTIYQLKIALRGLRPPIWRRVLVPSDIRLDALHHVLQATMGWSNSHLHAFTFDDRVFGEIDPSYGNDLEMENERRFKLSTLIKEPGARFFYEYDFGDSWEHAVTLEATLPADPAIEYPICIKGKRACPPEDCGGVWGYMNLLEILSDPSHEEHRAMSEWAGTDLDPEEFDLDLINRRLTWKPSE